MRTSHYASQFLVEVVTYDLMSLELAFVLSLGKDVPGEVNTTLEGRLWLLN